MLVTLEQLRKEGIAISTLPRRRLRLGGVQSFAQEISKSLLTRCVSSFLDLSNVHVFYIVSFYNL